LIFKSGNYPLYNSGSLNDGQLPPDTATAFNSPITMPGAGFYYNRKSGKYGCTSWFCADSDRPQWYGSPTNSGNLH